MALAFIGVGYVALDKFVLSKHPRADLNAVASAPTPTAVPEKSVAVLPSADMSEKKDQEYFSDGLSEELIEMLSRVRELRVPARTSSFYFKGKNEAVGGIAEKLRVANVLEGSVRKAGNQLRITVQLIRADNGYHLWSETYDRDAKDIFKVQDEITSAVVSALRLKLLLTNQEADANRSSNADAYDQYLRGMHYEHLGDLESERHALNAYNAAITLDPRYASAYAGLSFTESEIADFTVDQAGYARAQAAAEKALALSPHLTQGYRARANVRLRQLDLTGARADVEMALALSPGNGKVQDDYGNVLATFGRLSEAAAALNKATELEPQFAVAWMDLGALLCGLHRFTEARRAGDTAVSLAPGDPGGHAVLGTVNFFEGRFQDAQGEFQKVGEGAGFECTLHA
jgi:TolB-like protein